MEFCSVMMHRAELPVQSEHALMSTVQRKQLIIILSFMTQGCLVDLDSSPKGPNQLRIPYSNAAQNTSFCMRNGSLPQEHRLQGREHLLFFFLNTQRRQERSPNILKFVSETSSKEYRALKDTI